MRHVLLERSCVSLAFLQMRMNDQAIQLFRPDLKKGFHL